MPSKQKQPEAEIVAIPKPKPIRLVIPKDRKENFFQRLQEGCPIEIAAALARIPVTTVEHFLTVDKGFEEEVLYRQALPHLMVIESLKSAATEKLTTTTKQRILANGQEINETIERNEIDVNAVKYYLDEVSDFKKHAPQKKQTLNVNLTIGGVRQGTAQSTVISGNALQPPKKIVPQKPKTKVDQK